MDVEKLKILMEMDIKERSDVGKSSKWIHTQKKIKAFSLDIFELECKKIYIFNEWHMLYKRPAWSNMK